MARKVNDAGIELIQAFESCLEPIGNGNFAAYPDPGYGWSVATIGWGSTYYEDGRKVQEGDVIDQARADELFAFEINEKAAGVEGLIEIGTTDDQFAALSSFAYNCGTGALSTSTLLRKHNAGDFEGAAAEFLKWVNSNGQYLAGLERRRQSERNLYQSIVPAVVEYADFVSER